MCKQNIILIIKYYCKLRDTNPYFFTVNSAEKLVITVWEDFGESVGGAGGGIVQV